MKNTLLVLALTFAAAFSAQAQDSTTSDFKPVAGDKTIEVGSSLFFSHDYYTGITLQFRKFTSNTHAFRISTGAHINNTDDGKGASSTFGVLTISPGLERHFTGTSRLSPFIGAELPLSVSYGSYEDDTQKVKGGGSNGYGRSYKGVGLVAVAGVDFYIVKNFYVGLEFGAGINYVHFNDTEIDYKEPSMPDKTIEGGRSISFSTISNSGLRVGFVF